MQKFIATLSLCTVACGPLALGVEGTGESGESTTEVGTESSEDATETGFVPENDGGTKPAECDPWAQDCPEGEKCVPYASTGGNWDANKCVPIMGEQAPGEPCTSGGVVAATDDCDTTSICWDVKDVDGELLGTCLPFCTGTPDAPECSPQSYCLISGNGELNLCIPTCDPLAQDCGDGLACFWASGNFNCIFTTEEIPAGQPCGYINDCAAGLICIMAENLPSCDGSACCSGFCELELGDGPCEALLPGTVCVPFFPPDEAPEWYADVGICVAP